VRVFGLGDTVSTVWGIIGIVGAVLAIATLLWISAKGHADRHEEDAARAFFDANGHWPDEEPGELAR
jgi:hypothetical protein